MAQAERRHRSIPELIGDTFDVVGRRFRDIAVVAIVAAAFAVVSVAAFTAGADILNDEILENPRFEELMDLNTQADVESADTDAALEAWLDSVDWNRVVNAGLLLAVGTLISLFGWATSIAFTLVTLDDVDGRPSAAGRALGTGLARVPKVLLLAIVYAVAIVGVAIAVGLVALVMSLLHTVLGLLAIVVGVGVFVGTLVYFVPLAQMHFVMAYAEPGFPSPARWWRLIGVSKAATWGRSALIILANIAVGLILWWGLLALPSPYGDFISNAIAGPIITALTSIAFALMYADLSGRTRPSAAEWPELST